MKTRNVKLLFLCLLICLFCVGASIAEELKSLRLICHNSIAQPGKRVWLRAALKSEGGFLGEKSISDERLYFKWRDELIGVALTGKNGVATIVYDVPKDQRVQELTVEYNGSDKYAPVSRELRLYLFDKKRPMIICNIDETIFGATLDEFNASEPDDIQTAEGIPVALQALRQKHSIVYITKRDADFIEKFHSWMRIKNIPPGPIFNPEEGLSPLYKKSSGKDFLRDLKEIFPKLVIGISHDMKDVRRFLDEDLKAVLIDKNAREDSLPKGVTKASGWKEVFKIL